jgi:hypothetical protein
MKARSLLLSAWIALAAAAGPAEAATYYSTRIEVTVAADIARTWDFLSDFCSFVNQGGQASTCTNGNGGVGSIRLSADGTQDLVVATAVYGYAFERIAGPLAEADYHFALHVEEIDPLQSRIVVTLIWNEEGIPEAERGLVRLREVQGLEGPLQDAKLVAEAS